MTQEVGENHLVYQSTELRVVRRNEGDDNLEVRTGSIDARRLTMNPLTSICPFSTKRNIQSSQSLALYARIRLQFSAAFVY